MANLLPYRPLKCPTCQGHGHLIRTRPTTMYKCGFVHEAYSCPDCQGSGRKLVLPEDDRKVAAGGAA